MISDAKEIRLQKALRANLSRRKLMQRTEAVDSHTTSCDEKDTIDAEKILSYDSELNY